MEHPRRAVRDPLKGAMRVARRSRRHRILGPDTSLRKSLAPRPWAASSNDLDDNARVALLQEAALLLVDADELAAAEGLREAAERGIKARKTQTMNNPPGRKKRGRKPAETQPSKRELFLQETIDLSGERMMAYIICLEDNVGEENADENDKLYCICREPESGQMIACDSPDCSSGRWFHYECVGITSPPRGKWVCYPCFSSGPLHFLALKDALRRV